MLPHVMCKHASMSTALTAQPAILQTATLDSPVGEITVALRGAELCALRFAGSRTSVWQSLARRFGPDAEFHQAAPHHPVIEALRAYFAGDLAALDAIAVDPGGTAFQQRVWRELRRIPAGRTASYAEVAGRIGAPKAVRAVARANATNPAGIVIPCHRVIGADGALRGYGGGLDRKAWLLAHERAALT